MKAKLIYIISFIFIVRINAEPHLFKQFPNLQKSISHISFCDLPTPIIKLENFGKHVNCKNIYMKRDDLTGKKLQNGLRLYGGNKPRKLEFLLADALKKDAKTIITYGCAGSNHAVATAVYANELKLKPILMLKHQPNSYVVRHNLLLDNFYNAQLRFFSDNDTRNFAKDVLLKNNKDAYFFPTGGSNEIGTLGFVNAAFELAAQIKNGDIKEPDMIYIATSGGASCATVAGLLLGMKAAGLKSKIVGVCVEPEDEKDECYLKIKQLFEQTNNLLHHADSSFEIFEFPENDLILNKKFCGTEYGLFIPEAIQAIKLFQNTENIKLEGTYSAKPIAAIMDDVQNNKIKDQTILFWNTYCGIDFSHLSNFYDYKKLPQEFHKYFESDVQPLSK